MKKKKEIILLEELATLEHFKEEIKRNVYPLGIFLSEEEEKEYDNWKLSEIGKLYSPCMYQTHDRERLRLYLNAYELRKRIKNGEVYVNKFIDKTFQTKPVDYISESYGYDLDAPRIVFRKRPRIIFKKVDHYNQEKNDIAKGKDLLILSYKTAIQEIKEK